MTAERDALCPCDGAERHRVIHNPAGQAAIAYRVGDFASFREALLRPRPGERDLAHFRAPSDGDLALQIIEWWAYLADVLTFYNERIANDSYLATAQRDADVARLVRLLGYRPRPGIGATATLAALVSAPRPIELPAGLAIQSRPAAGEEPQIFELDRATVVRPGGAIAVEPFVRASLAGARSLLLEGVVTAIHAGDRVLVTSKKRDLPVAAEVAAVAVEDDARGRARTRVTFQRALGAPLSGDVADARVLWADTTTGLYPYEAIGIVDGKTIHLGSVVRGIEAGAPIVLEWLSAEGGSRVGALAKVASYAEQVWYAGASREAPSTPPRAPRIPVPILHSVLTLDADVVDLPDPHKVRVRYGFRDAGAVVPEDRTAVAFAPDTALRLRPVAPARFSFAPGDRVVVEDATGAGALATVTSSAPTEIAVALLSSSGRPLTPPLRVLSNLISVSRGASVAREILGSGDATVAGQSFVLERSPLTYLGADGAPSSRPYRSTLRIQVDGVAWREVPSFYGQPPDAQVFVAREDEARKTHVLFGDGIHGARLPTGSANVVASYRYGSGARAPAAGALTTLLKPSPGLQAVRNPVRAGGGDDPTPASEMRRYAPRTVLTFGRAVSAADYEAIAALAPGVARVRAEFAWDAEHQRARVVLYVGDDDAAFDAARAALTAVSGLDRSFLVKRAAAAPISLSLAAVRDPRYDDDAVKAGVARALLDPEVGLLGARRTRIGAALYTSQIDEAVTRVPGVLAVHGLSLGRVAGPGPRYVPGEGRFFKLDPKDLAISTEVAPDAR